MHKKRKEEITIFVAGLIGVLILCFLYELWFWCGLVFLLALLCSVPRINYYRKRAEEEAAIYYQVTGYMEQLLCSYKRIGQVLPALEDCAGVYQNEKIGDSIQKAIHIMKTGDGVDDSDITRYALKIIEDDFPSRRMTMIHEFICQAQKMGGDRDDAMDILLEELQLWKQRTQLYQKKRSFIRIDTMIAVFLAAIMCYISKLLTPKELGFRLPDTLLYQITTTAVLIAFLFTLVLVWKKLTGSWLDASEVLSEKQKESQKKQYDMVKGYQEPKNRIQKNLALKICKRQVEKDYPYWLLAVTLQMQMESVYNAIEVSKEHVSEIFQQEVSSLLEKIYQNPSALTPYLSFFEELKVPEIQTGMKILYSVGQNGYEESKRQLGFLLSTNNKTMDKNQVHHFENQTAGLSLLKHMPMMIACVKLLADLVNLLVLTMGMFQQIV